MLVYLFELDSVINNDKDLIERGQYFLFEEIFIKGNKVVLSMNQFVDSAIIYNLIKNAETYEFILELFKKGIIKVNLYSDITSTSKYVQDVITKVIDGKSQYIFSNLPVTCDNIELLQVINDSLKYSDLTLLNKYSGDKDKIDYIRNFINLVLVISMEESAKIMPKDTKELGFREIYDKINNLLENNSLEQQSNILDKFTGAWENIKILSKTFDDNNEKFEKRSEWYTKINESSFERQEKQLCFEIVNLFYNYTVQSSIEGVKVNYFDDESFFEEFLEEFNKNSNLVRYDTYSEIDSDSINDVSTKPMKLRVLRKLLKYLNFDKFDNETNNTKIVLKRIIVGFILSFLLFAFYIIVFIIVQQLLYMIDMKIEGKFIKSNSFANITIKIIMMCVLSSLITKVLKFPDILDSFSNILVSFIDILYYIHFKSKVKKIKIMLGFDK